MAINWDKLEEVDKFLEKCNLPQLNQEEIENMNKSITNRNRNCNQKSPNEQKPRARWLHRQILPKVWRRANNYVAITLPEN